jgi:hypothetical protein
LVNCFNAAIVIDLAIRSKAGKAAADFRPHERMPIRGRRETADIYVLSLATAKASENLQEAANISIGDVNVSFDAASC